MASEIVDCVSNRRRDVTLAMRVDAPSFASQAACWVCGGSELLALPRVPPGLPRSTRARIPSWPPTATARLARRSAAAAASVSPRSCRRCRASSSGCTTSAGPTSGWSGSSRRAYKDLIFRTILDELDRRVRPPAPRRLLDVGAHAGRFMRMSQLPAGRSKGSSSTRRPRHAPSAHTGAVVHRVGIDAVAADGRRYSRGDVDRRAGAHSRSGSRADRGGAPARCRAAWLP